MRSKPFLSSTVLLAALCGPTSGALAGDTKGYLYGSIQTKGGTTYEGRLRWGKEEAFWTDHFNASKVERPLLHDVPREHRHASEGLRIFGRRIGLRWAEGGGRQLVVRFGDLASILPSGSREATLVLKSREEVLVDGGSNDVGARITVWDGSLGEVQLAWEKIRRIDFKPTPADLPNVPARLFGTVRTTSQTFTGFVQWDKEECVATDVLDGESDEGKMKLEMGRIKAIERNGRRSSTVHLRDGRELVLRGTNDVDSDNRGIFVDDPRFGRVLVSWSAFERVDFAEGGSGPGYDTFPPAGPLQGVVTTRSGATHKGRLVYDVDEANGWETLDGEASGLSYSIPFSMVASVVRSGSSRSRVTLRGGTEELRLGESADVTDENAGVFVLHGDEKTYVPWEDVKRIDLEK